MRRATGLQARQHGIAAVGALLIVAVVTVIAAGILSRQGAQTHAAQAEQTRVQARWLLHAGLTWSRELLRREAQREPATRLDGLWRRPVLGLPVAGRADPAFARYRGEIVDETGKFNLRNLEWDGAIVASEVQAFAKLCALLDIPEDVAYRIMRRVLVAIPAPAETRGTSSRSAASSPSSASSPSPSSAPEAGPEDAAQRPSEQALRQRLGLPGGLLRRPQAPMIRTVDELAGVEGVGQAVADRLKPYVTVLPSRTWLNTNTTTAEVLAASVPGLALDKARGLLGQRDRGQWFVNRGDVMNRLQMPELQGRRLPLGIQSNFFLVRGAVEHQGVIRVMSALVHDDKKTLPTVVWSREGA